MADTQQEQVVEDGEPVDLSEINLESMDDPGLVHTHRLLTMYENESVLDGYDAVCLDCTGDKKIIAYEHVKNEKEEDLNCQRCEGSGRVIRTEG